MHKLKIENNHIYIDGFEIETVTAYQVTCRSAFDPIKVVLEFDVSAINSKDSDCEINECGNYIIS